MKGKASKIILVVLIILVMLSVFIAGTMIAMPVLKKKDVTIAKDQTDKIKHSYANEDTSSSDSQEITRNYEIKEEETWDVSKNQNGSVMAKWTLSDKTIRISGSGEMKEWEYNEENDWHGTGYSEVIRNAVIEDGVTSIGDEAFSRCTSLASVKIPSSVRGIGKKAFSTCSSLISVEIPSSVTSIGSYAFYRCSSLASIEIPSSVTSIGYEAFEGCSSLASIEIPSSVTSIGYEAFGGCSSLPSIEIPSSVTSIGSSAFYGCSSLKEIKVDINNEKYADENGILYDKNKTSLLCYPAGKIEKNFMIPSSVTNIERRAFNGCNGLASIKIPSSVTSIEYKAFEGCSSLASIEIPSSVTSIEWYAFYGCSSLESIEIPSSVTSIGSSAFEGCSSLASIEIPSSVTSIGDSAFCYCTNLANIEIPSSVTSIEYKAFEGCSSLVNVEIPSSVTSIGDNAFYGCSSLASVKIPESVTSIGWRAFYGCSSLASIKIPSGVKSIEEYAFWGCSSLEGIEIPSSVTSIGRNAFYGCSTLENIEIPSSVTYIGIGAIPDNTVIYVQADTEGHKYAEEKKHAYVLSGEANSISTNYKIEEVKMGDISEKQDGSVIAKWTLSNKTLRISGTGKMKSWISSNKDDWTQYTMAIKDVIIEDSVINIGNYAFYECSNLESIRIPSSVTSIGHMAFYRCSSLASIEIPSSVTSIGSWAFYGCSGLKSIEIPNSVTSIGECAFSECSSLKSIEIPNSVTSIEDSAFSGCSSLARIEIPSSVTSIGSRAFNKCDSLKIIKVDSNNKNYIDEDGVLYDKNKTRLICCPNGREEKDLVVPSSVTSIEFKAFSGCSSLESVEIPCSVTRIESWAFSGCSSLKNIEIPIGVTSIEDGTFNKCSSLTSIEIPSSVTNIKRWVFDGCSSLKSIKVDSNNKNYIDEDGVLYNKNKTELICYPVKKIGEEFIIPGSVTELREYIVPSNVLIYTKLNSEGHRYAEENKQGYIIDDEAPTVTFDPIGNESTQKQHSTKITIKDNMVGINEEKLKYQWTQSEEIPSQENFTQNFENEQTITKDTGDGNWYLWIYAEDKVGNVTITRSNAFNFDNTPPVTNVEYSTTQPTRENIIVTIKSNEPVQEVEGWKLSEDKMTLTKEYGNNTTEAGEKVEIKDLVGNSTTVTVKIVNIDREAPKPEVKYSTKDLTNKNVVVTITSNEQIQAVDGWTISEDKRILTKEYEKNTADNGEVIEVKDLAGNSATVTIKMNNIDKEAPEAEVEYSTLELTEKGVIAKIRTSEPVQGVEGWNLLDGKQTLTKEYINNTTEEGEKIEIRDLAGNSTTVTVKITNIIDKIPPELEIIYSTEELTNKNVIVTIKSNEPIQEAEGWILSADKKSLTKEYEDNTAANGEIIEIKDLAGNSATATIKITNIDKEAPNPEIKYSTTRPTRENIIVTITSNEQIQAVEGWTISEDKMSLTKEYANNTTANGEIIEIKDLAGNSATATIKITNIDREAPKPEVKYSTKDLTNKNVVVTITSNEQIQAVDGWKISEDKMTLTKEYANNTTANGEVIEVKDLAGNSATVTITITNIDKEAPKPEVKYSITEITAQNVIATIKSNEPIQEVEGWKLSEDKMSLTKEYVNNTAANGEVIEIKDLVGNSTTVTIKILNIQRKFETDQYKKVNDYIVKIKPNTTYNEFIKNIQTNQTYTVKEGSKIISGTNTIKTGQVLTTQTGKQYTLVVMGDLNGDGKIGIIELARISKIGSGKIKDYKEIEKMAIDANADGKINILDLAVIAKLATGK